MFFIVLFVIFILWLLFDVRNDKVFSAYDEIHGITLYEKNNDFEISNYHSLDTFNGKYSLKGDTIFLVYDLPNKTKHLPRKILIDTKSQRVRGIDGKGAFCANISLDKRK